MSVYGQGVDITIVAGADISGKQYQPVNLAGVLSTSAENVIGVLQNKPVAGEAAAVRISGLTKVYMPISLGADANIMQSNATSGFIALQTSGYPAFGKIVFAANSGDFATALLYGGPVRQKLV